MLQEWLLGIAQQYQFLGVVLVSFIGSLSIVFPVPYTLVILLLGIGGMNPIILTVAGGLGSAIGEFSGYALGYYGRRLISQERRRKMDFFVKVFDRYGPLAVFLFALTPLPDDLLFIPLGMLRYSFWKMFLPCIAGKTFMCFLLAYFGGLFGDLILLIFGEEESWVGMLITIVLLVSVLVVLLKVDWERVFERYAGKKRLGVDRQLVSSRLGGQLSGRQL